MQTRFTISLVAAIVFVPAVLLGDGPGIGRQISLALLTSLFLWLITRHSSIDRMQIAIAIAVATTGEVILSLGWGLYSYRHAVIPLYVPVGHGVFYSLAALSARQSVLRRAAHVIRDGVLVAGSLLAIGSWVFRGDSWGILWWITAAILIRRARDPLLVSCCFVYTMLLEWLGTWLGNWVWASRVPYLGLHSGNPPSGVGLLYVVLDIVTIAIWSRLTESSAADAAARPIALD